MSAPDCVCDVVCVCVCVGARGGFSESIGCDGGGCSISLSCCDAEAGSRSEITDRLATDVHVSCVSVCASFCLHLTLLTDGDIVSSSPCLLQLACAFCFLLAQEHHFDFYSSSFYIFVVFVWRHKEDLHTPA